MILLYTVVMDVKNQFSYLKLHFIQAKIKVYTLKASAKQGVKLKFKKKMKYFPADHQ